MTLVFEFKPAQTAFNLKVDDDGGHAFYLGVQLGRAQIAWQLGKRFVQDEALTWGCAVEQQKDDLNQYKDAGSTMKQKNINLKDD